MESSTESSLFDNIEERFFTQAMDLLPKRGEGRRMPQSIDCASGRWVADGTMYPNVCWPNNKEAAKISFIMIAIDSVICILRSKVVLGTSEEGWRTFLMIALRSSSQHLLMLLAQGHTGGFEERCQMTSCFFLMQHPWECHSSVGVLRAAFCCGNARHEHWR